MRRTLCIMLSLLMLLGMMTLVASADSGVRKGAPRISTSGSPVAGSVRKLTAEFELGTALPLESVDAVIGTWRCIQLKTADGLLSAKDLGVESILTIDKHLLMMENRDAKRSIWAEDAILSGYGVAANGVVYLFGEELQGISLSLYDNGILEAAWLRPDASPEACYYRRVEVKLTPTPDLPPVSYKPVIYLYPEIETDVQVSLHYDGELTCTWPAYEEGWQVHAKPDGTLTDADGHEYSYLFWEGSSDTEYDFSRGFCVPGSESGSFLRNSLEALGLTPREYNEFIVFWLPRLQENPYNLIAFQGDCYTEHARLDISPAPDTLLRVFMAYRPLQTAIQIAPQTLNATVREGFTVVEWGGTELP